MIDLALARRALRYGVGMTTREDKVLPPVEQLPEIPARTGVGKPKIRRITEILRGWYAHVVGALRSACFAHDTLAVRDPGTEVFGYTYSVLPFATPYNVPAADTTKLNDVLSFKDGAILINGLALPMLGVTAGAPAGALPWLIPHGTPVGDLGKYGDSVTNATVKRVFAVGRAVVHAWANGGVDAALGGAAYRPNKALVCGARIDAANHVAWLAQLAYTGSTWDALTGAWLYSSASIAMLLTAPYLSSVGSALTPDRTDCVPVPAGTSTGTEETELPLPECQMMLHGTCNGFSYLFGTAPDQTGGRVGFPWDGTYDEAPVGYESNAYSRTTYTKTVSESISVGDQSVTVLARNTRIKSTNTGTVGHRAQWHTRANTGQKAVLAYSDGSYFPTNARGGTFGATEYGVPAKTYGSAVWTSDSSTGEFSSKIGSRTLVGGSFSRERSAGNRRALTKNDWAASYLANPSGGWGVNMGYNMTGFFDLYAYVSPYTKYSAGWQAAVASMHATAQMFVGSEAFSTLDDNQIYVNQVRYTATTQSRQTVDTRALSWTTSDYVLFDEANACYISVEAAFSGSQVYGATGSATLAVDLKISTPQGDATQSLFIATLDYADLLPEITLTTGVTYVPNPRVRVLFTPLYRSQGDFMGAAYTTSAEVSAGATPTYLFNFVLTLDTYDAIGTDTLGLPVVHFIPCNLLEMLYAYVFSQDYGIKSTERYPVTFATRYNEFVNTLFSNQWRVNYRNGALTDWLDTLGGAYVTEQTTELSRF
jgi:hypothetical protein